MTTAFPAPDAFWLSRIGISRWHTSLNVFCRIPAANLSTRLAKIAFTCSSLTGFPLATISLGSGITFIEGVPKGGMVLSRQPPVQGNATGRGKRDRDTAREERFTPANQKENLRLPSQRTARSRK